MHASGAGHSMSFRLFLALALLACLSSTAVSRELFQVKECPINPGSRSLDFSAPKAGCGAQNDACTTCVCSIYTAFIPAFQAANLTYNATSATPFNKSEADAILRVCTPAYVVQATMAGVDINSLLALQQCPADAVPECLTSVVQHLTPESKAAAAAAPQADPGTLDKVVNGVQVVVNAGRDAVDAVKKGVDWIKELFS